MSTEQFRSLVSVERPSEVAIWLSVGPGRDKANHDLGALVRKRRNAAGLSVADVASALGLSPGYLRMIERGERVPTAETAAHLLQQIGLDVSREPAIGGGNRPDLIVHDTDGQRIAVDFKSRVKETSQVARQLQNHLATALFERWANDSEGLTRDGDAPVPAGDADAHRDLQAALRLLAEASEGTVRVVLGVLNAARRTDETRPSGE